MNENETPRADELEEACCKMAEEHGLSKTEETVLHYWVTGYTKGCVAEALCLAESTIDSHVKKMRLR